ncbi:hypothetical protein [Senegalimassilia anaerobia]|uniref:hypothetical protein n=1 Tax=Senegalimassilia anaerobia TaxID=1473216 RepID=UPI00248D4D53|nr:hypothetical protein [Senegalimassilia anaerobia]
MTKDNEQRRSIANNLRRDAMYRSGGSLAEWWSRLQELVTGEVDFPDPQEMFLALADLIEPGVDDDED